MLSNKSLRILVILATLAIVGITATQIYWVRKAFDINQDQFERDVRSALYNVAQELFLINEKPIPNINPVEQVAGNYFIVNLMQEFDVQSLEQLVRSHLAKRNIAADFEYGIYNCDTDQMVYCNYVDHTENDDVQRGNTTLAKSSKQEYYFGVYFPGQYAQIINRMGVWIYSSVVLILVIIFFAFTMFVILKQRRLSEIQRDFINNMTHEFKTPISTINISAGVIQNPEIAKNPQRLLNYATIIQKESNRLQNQVDQILKAAHVTHTTKDLDKSTVDMHTVINDAFTSFEALINDKGGEIKVLLKAKYHSVIGDQLHLTNVILNLIDNAIKYGQDAPSVCVETDNNNKDILIKISDNGQGVSKDQQKKIFDKFYRVPTGDRHDVKGFGLGLYYVKYIIEAHGGHVQVSSNNQGSTFIVHIPYTSIS